MSADQEPDEEQPAASEGDALPDDLDVTAYVGPYTFPDVRRRLIPATIYLVIVLGCVLGFVVSGNAGLLAAAIMLGVIAAYHVIAAWPLRVDQTDALAAAARGVGFPVGHASAQLAFRGLRAKPVWHVLVYSADSPPGIRGLVEVDAVNGDVLGEYTERNPEDWSEFGIASPDQ